MFSPSLSSSSSSSSSFFTPPPPNTPAHDLDLDTPPLSPIHLDPALLNPPCPDPVPLTPTSPTHPVPTTRSAQQTLSRIHDECLIQSPSLERPDLERETTSACPESVRRVWRIPESVLLALENARVRAARGVGGQGGCMRPATPKSPRHLGLPGLYPAGLLPPLRRATQSPSGDGNGDTRPVSPVSSVLSGAYNGTVPPPPSPVETSSPSTRALAGAWCNCSYCRARVSREEGEEGEGEDEVPAPPPTPHHEDPNASTPDVNEQWYCAYRGARTPPPLPPPPAPIAPPASSPPGPPPHSATTGQEPSTPSTPSANSMLRRVRTRRVALGLALVSACERKSSSGWLAGLAEMRRAGVDMEEFYEIMELGLQERTRRKAWGMRNRELREGNRRAREEHEREREGGHCLREGVEE